MGIYVFTARFLFELLCLDATRPDSTHDFGKDIIPAIIETHRVFAYPFMDENRKQDAYWRDVGTLDAYYQANMDLVAVDPVLNMYDRDWPIRTYQPNLPPPKFVFARGRRRRARRGEALDSMVCLGCIISGGQVRTQSSSSPNVRINSYAGWKTRSCSTASTWAGIAAFAGPLSTRGSHPARHRHRLRSGQGSRAAASGDRLRHYRNRQDRRRGGPLFRRRKRRFFGRFPPKRLGNHQFVGVDGRPPGVRIVVAGFFLNRTIQRQPHDKATAHAGVLSISIVPPCKSTSSLVMARPMPVPNPRV